MRVLLTGASGFIGSHLTKVLLAKKCEVCVLVQPESDLRRISSVQHKIKTIFCDYQKIEEIEGEIKKYDPDICYHLGWWGASSIKFRNEARQIYENIEQGLKLVEAVGKTRCKKFIGLGSVLEYGDYPVPVNEFQICSPKCVYGAGKLAFSILAERLCDLKNMKLVWFRLFWSYGPDDHENRLIPYVITSLLRKEEARLTMCEQWWDYIYVDDVTDVLFRAGVEPHFGGTFNLGSGTSQRLKDTVEFLRAVIDSNVPVGYGKRPYEENQIMHLRADVGKLRDALKWSPRVSLEDGLKRTVEWNKSRRASLSPKD